MKRVSIIYDPRYLDHKPEFYHPERPERASSIINFLKSSDIKNSIVFESPIMADEEIIELNHSKQYIDYIKNMIDSGNTIMD